MCYHSATGSEFWRDATPIARKEHTCDECGEKILKGTPYKYYVGKQYGEGLWQAKICLQCDEDWGILVGIEDENDPGGTWEERHICLGCLRERIQAAFDSGWIGQDHPLLKRWIPEELLKEPSDDDGKEGKVLVGKDNPLQMFLPI